MRTRSFPGPRSGSGMEVLSSKCVYSARVGGTSGLAARVVTLEETAWPLARTSAHGLRRVTRVRADCSTSPRQDPSCSGTRVLVVAHELIWLA